jgi:hypothetical protein
VPKHLTLGSQNWELNQANNRVFCWSIIRAHGRSDQARADEGPYGPADDQSQNNRVVFCWSTIRAHGRSDQARADEGPYGPADDQSNSTWELR